MSQSSFILSFKGFTKDTVKFCLKILYFLPFIILIAAFNYLVDPANIFAGGKSERKMAEYIGNGYNVYHNANYDERITQKFIIEKNKDHPEIIVIGSSRSMGIRKNHFSGKSFFNNSVTGATLEDYMAIYGIYRHNRILPKTVILGIDPWVFNRNNKEIRWKSLNNYYWLTENEMIPGQKKIGFRSFNYEKYTELLSFNYFRRSIWKFIGNLKGEKLGDFIPTKDMEGMDNLKLSDGSLVYNEKVRKMNADQVLEAARTYANEKPVYGFENYNAVDAFRLNMLDSFIKLLKDDSVKVIIFLPPFHPGAYKLLVDSGKYDIIGTAESDIRAVAKKYDLLVLGSYDPDRCNIKEEFFYDGQHMNSKGFDLIFGNLTEEFQR